MRVLVIGGSVFVGRAVVDEALAIGAEVTVFNRGHSGPAPAGVTHVRGDRGSAADLEQVRGQRFDLVVDTSGYLPAQVAASAAALAPATGCYVFVSTVSVFPGWPTAQDYVAAGAHDGDPDATAAPDGFDASASYGWLKAGCERAVHRVFGPRRCSILRAGPIVGPHDSAIGRLPWWLARFARGGEVLTPGAPSDPVQFIDARDLARFALSATSGTFILGGTRDRDTRGDLVAACHTVTGGAAHPVWVDSEWLADRDVTPWAELPLWVAPSQGPSVFTHDSSAAEAAGLRIRPLHETVADTWGWLRDGGQVPPDIGIAADKEQALIQAWRTASP